MHQPGRGIVISLMTNGNHANVFEPRQCCKLYLLHTYFLFPDMLPTVPIMDGVHQTSFTSIQWLFGIPLNCLA